MAVGTYIVLTLLRNLGEDPRENMDEMENKPNEDLLKKHSDYCSF